MDYTSRSPSRLVEIVDLDGLSRSPRFDLSSPVRDLRNGFPNAPMRRPSIPLDEANYRDTVRRLDFDSINPSSPRRRSIDLSPRRNHHSNSERVNRENQLWTEIRVHLKESGLEKDFLARFWKYAKKKNDVRLIELITKLQVL